MDAVFQVGGSRVSVWKPGRDFTRKKVIFIATYVISDIQGQYDMFMELPDKIKFKETDMSIEELDEEKLDNMVTWQYNGNKSTINEFNQWIPRQNKM